MHIHVYMNEMDYVTDNKRHVKIVHIVSCCFLLDLIIIFFRFGTTREGHKCIFNLDCSNTMFSIISLSIMRRWLRGGSLQPSLSIRFCLPSFLALIFLCADFPDLHTNFPSSSWYTCILADTSFFYYYCQT